jgi:hypothetical protein
VIRHGRRLCVKPRRHHIADLTPKHGGRYPYNARSFPAEPEFINIWHKQRWKTAPDANAGSGQQFLGHSIKSERSKFMRLTNWRVTWSPAKKMGDADPSNIKPSGFPLLVDDRP